MSEEKIAEFSKKTGHDAIDVFTHSRTGFPGSWTEEEIQILLDTWEEVLSKPRSRRFSINKKIHKRLSVREDFRDVKKDDIIKQMNTLRTEYTFDSGLQILGLETVQYSYVEQLERIFRKMKYLRLDGRRQRRNIEQTGQADAASEDSDHSQSQYVSYVEWESEQKELNETRNNDEQNYLPSVKQAVASVMLKSEVVQQANEIFSPSVVYDVVFEHLKETATNFTSLHELCEKVLENDEKRIRERVNPTEKGAVGATGFSHSGIIPMKRDVTLDVEDRLLCKICMDEEVGIVFQPCGHLATCETCAAIISECPLCRKLIETRVKTYWS